MTTGLVDAVRAGLAAGGDPERAIQQQAYMKSALPYHGLGLPEVRRLVRALVSEHPAADRREWEATVLALWDGATHREEWYAAVAVLRDRRHEDWVDPDLLPLLRHVVETGAWWDVVDEVAAHLVGRVLAGHRDRVSPVLRTWGRDEDLWVRRTAILAQLRHGVETDTELLGTVLDDNLEGSLHGSEFFIRKAVGWALRQHARVDPGWVQEYVRSREGRLSGLSRREALKHFA